MLAACRFSLVRSIGLGYKVNRLSTSKVLNLDGIEQVAPEKLLPLLPESEIINDEDLQIIAERQLDHSVSGVYAVESNRCKHGIVRAMIQYPCSGRVGSGMIRLTCPHLVKEIDEWEADGAIERINNIMINDEELQNNFQNIHEKHAKIRQMAVTEKEKDIIIKKIGKQGSEHFLNCGIIGISHNRLDDIKCVHAQVADYLLRGRKENMIGTMCVDMLQEERGVDVNGCTNCKQQCDLNVPKEEANWWYMPAKNKQGLRQSKERRKEHRASVAAKRERERRAKNERRHIAWLESGKTFSTELDKDTDDSNKVDILAQIMEEDFLEESSTSANKNGEI